jgi:uncharacterized GH25 family protein
MKSISLEMLRSDQYLTNMKKGILKQTVSGMVFLSRLIAVSVIALAATPAFSHELKVFASQQSMPEAGGKSTVYLSWGHRVPVDDLIDGSSLEKYEIVGPDGVRVALKSEGISLHGHSVVLDKAGVTQVAVVRKPSVFTYVLDRDGVRQFKRGGKTKVTEGKIDTAMRSVTCGKAMIVVGKPGNTTAKPLGHPIEILPLEAPSKWTANEDLKFQIVFDGKPVFTDLPTVEARSIGLKPDAAWSFTTKANKNGEFNIRPDKPGIWILKVNVKRPAAESDRVEFDQESFTATLTLEVLP